MTRVRTIYWMTIAALALAGGVAASDDLRGYTKDPIFLKWAVESNVDGTDLLPPIDGTWRVIERTNEWSTSTCIGRPSTPLCALETYRACTLRGDDEICAAAWNRPDAYWPHARLDPILFHWQIRIVMTRLLTSEDIREWDAYHKSRYRWRPGDVAIGYVTRACYDPFEGQPWRDCEKPKRFVDLILLRRDGPVWFMYGIESSAGKTREFD